MTICDRCGLNYKGDCVSRECKRTPDITPPRPRPLSDRERALVDANQAFITHIEEKEWQCPYCASYGGCGHAELCPFEPIETAIRSALAAYQAHTDGN